MVATTLTSKLKDREIRFKFSEFPNDLKMLAFLAGELTLSARFFSTFANVMHWGL